MKIWFIISLIVGMVLTIGVLYLLIKEIKSSIKNSNDGKVSNRCDLD
jgi:hypothetical protein